MLGRHSLYRYVANVEPSNCVPSDLGSVKWLWRNLASSPGIASIPSYPSQDPPPRVDSDFMSIDVTGTYLIPACGWRRAQRRPSDRFKIGAAVVEESAIEFRISRDNGPQSRGWAISMSISPTGTHLIPACSWRQAQQRPSNRFKIG